MEKINPGSLKAWVMLPRFQFLPLTIILVSLGTAIASYEGYFHLGHFLLAMLGSVLGANVITILGTLALLAVGYVMIILVL